MHLLEELAINGMFVGLFVKSPAGTVFFQPTDEPLSLNKALLKHILATIERLEANDQPRKVARPDISA